jgi:hypothetical protein
MSRLGDLASRPYFANHAMISRWTMVNQLFGVAPHRVIDMAAVVRLAWIEDTVKPVIHIQDWGAAPHGQLG